MIPAGQTLMEQLAIPGVPPTLMFLAAERVMCAVVITAVINSHIVSMSDWMSFWSIVAFYCGRTVFESSLRCAIKENQ